MTPSTSLRSFRACAASLILLAALGFAPSADADVSAVEVDFELLVAGLGDTVDITHAGDGSGRLFFVEQAGAIRVFRNGQLLATPFLDISGIITSGGERGLLGLAFDPDYDVNGFFYVNYTDLAGDTVIARYSVSLTSPNRADPASEVILKTIAQPFSNHNGGDVAFGPDGMLYSGIGDGGSASDPGNRAQDLTLLLGKMLRLDVDAPPDYIPVDNPFVGDPSALDEIWAYGLRNPWRFSFDRLTGDMLIGDVGQNAVEEVDFQPATSTGGENWGWKVLEGTSCHSDVPAGICDDFLTGDSVLPIAEYSHTGGNCSITGGFRYRGSDFPDLDGVYFYADFCTGILFAAIEEAPGVWCAGEVLDTPFNISTFGEDEDGELYFANLDGEIYRLISTAGGGVPCADVANFQAQCIVSGPGNRIRARAILTDATHDGQTVTIGVDGATNVVTITGDRASFQQSGAAPGAHTISLDDPAGCFPDVIVNCP